MGYGALTSNKNELPTRAFETRCWRWAPVLVQGVNAVACLQAARARCGDSVPVPVIKQCIVTHAPRALLSTYCVCCGGC